MKNKKLLLIMNPCAGLKVGKRHLADILALFCEAGYIPTVFITGGRHHGRQLAAAHAAAHDLIVCMGGDGTFNEVVAGVTAAGSHTPIGYIPCGSTNDFAGSMQLSRNLLQAARDILGGCPKPLDIGRFGERHFSYIASCGAFTRASYATPQNMKNIFGHLAYILEGIKDLKSLRPYRLHIETPDAVYEDDYVFCAICNTTSVAGILTLDPAVVDMQDGLLELLLIRHPQNASELNECIIALQEHNYNSPMLTLCSTNTLTIHTDPTVEWTLDGEYEPAHDTVTVTAMHNAITLITPKEAEKCEIRTN